MRVGAIFPQTEIGTDPAAVRELALAVEDAGYDHLLVYDHVMGADSRVRPGWDGPYDHTSQFHEPFVLLGLLAAITQRVELVTGVIVLGQRQTVLVAKQAAEVDVLSGGRLRLGIGVGWNDVEYEALGENFRNRGKRSEEQVALMRQLWTNELVTFHGEWHTVEAAGINPLPVQRPIPLWFGGRADALLRRVARSGDGLIVVSYHLPDERGSRAIDRMRRYAEEAGRDPASIGLDGRANLLSGGIKEAVAEAEQWRALGATHVSFNTMRAGLGGPADHIRVFREFKGAMG